MVTVKTPIPEKDPPVIDGSKSTAGEVVKKLEPSEGVKAKTSLIFFTVT